MTTRRLPSWLWLALAAVALSVPAGAASGASGCTIFLPVIRRPGPLNLWRAEYYANRRLGGSPAAVADERRIDYDWGTRSPHGLPKDNFSVRWSGWWNMEEGETTFTAYADDGVRLWLDGALLIDEWNSLPAAYHHATVTVPFSGPHRLVVEYYEETGEAVVSLQWRRTDLYPFWLGSYYANAWLESPKAYRRYDTSLQFDWGLGCPTGLPCDYFSVSWTAEPLFLAGRYRLLVYADEGYQLYVDGVRQQEDEWDDRAVDADYGLVADRTRTHRITFNMHDRGGPAEARLWVENLDDPPWDAEYYDNKNLGGKPVKTGQDVAVFHDWGQGRPTRGLPTDRFSIRWDGQPVFHAGCYRFYAFADDGVRLWVDGELLIDEWHNGSAEYHSLLTYLDSGSHQVIVDYYEDSGDAEIRIWWE